MFVFYKERGKTTQQRELYRKRASAPGKVITVSGKEEGAQPRFHVRGAWVSSGYPRGIVELSLGYPLGVLWVFLGYY